MFVLALRVELFLPHAASLKDRRAAITPVLEGARHRFRVSAAEVGHQNLWQRAALGFAAVGSAEHVASEVIDNVERFVWSFPEYEVSSATRHWLEFDA